MAYSLEALYADVAQIQHETLDIFGSGRLVGKDLILTARHVLIPEDKTEPLKNGWRTRLLGNRPSPGEGQQWVWMNAMVVWVGKDALDLALLQIMQSSNASDLQPKLALKIACIDEVQHRLVRGLGFPRGAKNENRRTLFVPSGHLDDENETTLSWGIDQAYQPESPGEDWRGFSGASILLEDNPESNVVWIYGVAQHVPPNFIHRLAVARLAVALKDEAFCQILGAAGVSTESASDPVLNAGRPQPPLAKPVFRGSKFYFGSRTNEFIGRDRCLRQLSAFLQSEKTLQWWTVTGKAGAGKSRLALEFGLSIDPSWAWGFMSLEEFDWKQWIPNKPTLIFFDYAGSDSDHIGRLIEILSCRRDAIGTKVRILLLERSLIGGWWEKLLGVGRRQEAILSTIFSSEPLQLEKMSTDSLAAIFMHYAQSSGLPEQEIKSVVSSLAQIDPECRPLFAALAGDATAAGRDLRNWDQERLMRFHQTELDKRWKPQGVREIDKSLLAFVTIAGRMKVEDLLLADLRKYLPDAESFSPQLYEVMVGVKSDEYLIPYEPDILGEFFVLEYLKPRPFHKQKTRDFGRALWTNERLSVGAFLFIRRVFNDFPSHETIDLLLEPSPDYLPFFWGAAFHIYIDRKADTDIAEARKLYDSSKTIFQGSLPTITWLGRCETAQYLCLKYLDRDKLEEAQNMYKDVSQFFELFKSVMFFAESRATCSWGLADFNLNRKDVASAIQYFDDLVDSLAFVRTESKLNELGSKAATLSFKLLASLASSTDHSNGAEDLSSAATHLKQQLAKLCRQPDAPQTLVTNVQLQSAWWASTTLIIEYQISVGMADEALSESVTTLFEESDTASVLRSQIQIIDSLFTAIVKKWATDVAQTAFIDQLKTLAINADRIRQKSGKGLESVVAAGVEPAGFASLWGPTYFLAVYTLLRFNGMCGQTESLEECKRLLVAAGDILNPTQKEDMRLEDRMAEATIFCAIGFAVKRNVGKLIQTVNDLVQKHPKLQLDFHMPLLFALIIGNVSREIESGQTPQELTALCMTLFNYFDRCGAVDSLVEMHGTKTRAEALATYRMLLLE